MVNWKSLNIENKNFFKISWVEQEKKNPPYIFGTLNIGYIAKAAMTKRQSSDCHGL